MPQAPIAPDIFSFPAAEPQLIGSRCDVCGATTFPTQAHCPRCGRPEMVQRFLPRRGTLVTWTTQEFFPPDLASGETAETFTPYAVGLIQLGDEVRVEARLTEADAASLRFDMEVDLVVVPFRIDDDGTEVFTFAFSPV